MVAGLSDNVLRIVMQVIGSNEAIKAFTNVTKTMDRMRGITGAVNDSLIRQSKRVNVNTEFLKTNTRFFRKYGDTGVAATNQVNAGMKGVSKTLKVQQSLYKKLLGSMLGMGLSFLFTGMAIKRFAQTALRSMFNTFQQLVDSSHQGFQAIQELNASFTFLKFMMFDALSQSELFLTLVDFVVSLIDAISNFVGKHPAIAKVIGLFLILGIIVGSIMMVFGQTTLGLLGILAAIELWGKISGSALGKVFKWIGKIALVLLVLVVMFILIKATVDSELHPILKFFIILGILILGITLIMKILGVVNILAWLPLIIIVGALIAAFILMARHVGGVKNAFRAFGIFILAILAFVGDAIFELVILPLRLIIASLKVIARSKLGRKMGWSEIAQPEFAPLSKKVWDARNELLAEATAKKLQEESKERETKEVSIDDTSIDKIGESIGEKFGLDKLGLDEETMEALSSMTADKNENSFVKAMEDQGILFPVNQVT